MTNALLQNSLFDFGELDIAATIPGLTYIPEYITREQENELISVIDQQIWDYTLKRRVQHYGYQYNYRTKAAPEHSYKGILPLWLADLAADLRHRSIFPVDPDQVIINEYLPGQGIALHVDHVDYFTDVVCSLSLGSACVMDFNHDTTHSLLLDPRSLLILKGEARYLWKHGISKRRYDGYNGGIVARRRRISLTFRKVALS
ncbi:MAG: alpha-ketoglutarate-dependent dioxygenase AlkB [Proteobacteria bacterium]|nr:alpha-ketoglutarate-dependent dioxygenase AlkB [Pseudomonadota bacterium]